MTWKEWFIGLAGIVIGAASTVAVGGLEYYAKDREMDIRMIEIALDILREKPESEIRAAREWAVDLIDSHSPKALKFSQQARDYLIDNKVDFQKIRTGIDWGDSYSYDYTAPRRGRNLPKLTEPTTGDKD